VKLNWMQIIFLCLFLSSQGLFGANNIIQERTNQQKKLQEPLRLTFGPDDSFQSSRSIHSGQVAYTFRSHLTNELRIQEPQSKAFTVIAGAEHGVFSPNGLQLAYLQSIVGQGTTVCVRQIQSGDNLCLKKDGSKAEAIAAGKLQFPFWVDDSVLGFQVLVDDLGQADAATYIWNLKDQTRRQLLKGPYFHPTSSPLGQTVFVKTDSEGSRLVTMKQNSSSKELCEDQLDWLGFVAYPSFSSDGQQLVFSFHMLDTNLDGRVDFKDQATVARIQAADLCQKKPIRPEILTSFEKDCSHPKMSNRLDLTCSFDGSLDIYHLPLTGQIPSTWNQKDLLGMHASARRPEERLFVLLHLWGQKNLAGALEDIEYRIWQQFILLEDDLNSLRWWPKAKAIAKTKGKITEVQLLNSAILEIYFRAGLIAKGEPPGELSVTSQLRLQELLKSLEKQKESALKAIATSKIHWLLRSSGDSKKLLLQAMRSSELTLVEILFIQKQWELFNLSEELFLEFLARNTQAADEGSLSLWVRSLERLEANPERKKILEKFLRSQSAYLSKGSAVRELLDSEVLILEFISGEKNSYLKFDQKLSNIRDRELLLRAISYRAIRSWTKADSSKEVQFVARNLLKFLKPDSVEWTFAYQYFTTTAMDRAYETEYLKQPKAALGHFYSGLTLMEGFEPHWGYSRNMVRAGLGSDLRIQIDELKKRNFITEEEPIVRALAGLSMIEFDSSREKESKQARQEFLKQSESWTESEDGLLHLLQGSLRFGFLVGEPWIASNAQLKESEIILRHYTLALDASQENPRMRKVIFENLALLHSHRRDWGQSSKAWQQRFSLLDQVASTTELGRYFWAQSLMHIGETEKAYNVLADLSVESIPAEWKAAVHHRRALLAFTSLRYTECAEAAARVPFLLEQSQAINSAQVKLLRGLCLLKLKNSTEAEKQLKQVWEALEKNPSAFAETAAQSRQGPNARSRHRLQILTSGFLHQATNDLKWIRERAKLLRITQKDAEAMALPGVSFYELRLKNFLHLRAAGDEQVKTWFEDLDGYRNNLGVVASDAWFESLYGAMILYEMGILQLAPAEEKGILERVILFLNSKSTAVYQSPHLLSQSIRLTALAEKFELRSGAKALSEAHSNQVKADLEKLKSASPALGKKTEDWLKIMKLKL